MPAAIFGMTGHHSVGASVPVLGAFMRLLPTQG